MVQNNGRSHWTDERLDELANVVQANQQQITSTSLAVDRLADVVLQLAVKMDNQIEIITQQQAAMNAEQERQGRILDYLMRRDGED